MGRGPDITTTDPPLDCVNATELTVTPTASSRSEGSSPKLICTGVVAAGGLVAGFVGGADDPGPVPTLQ
jgi:hypothetical protein